MSTVDLTKLDLYELLEVPFDACEKEIRTAYRKKALKLHPDKNQDNPEAKQRFQELCAALQILTDTSAKAAYDRVLKARKEAELRNRKLDSKRRKLKEELEERERAYQTTGKVKTAHSQTPEDQLKAEIERLKKQGSALFAEEQERIRKELANEREQASSGRVLCGRLKISWNVEPGSIDPYSYEELHKILQKFGHINLLIISQKKSGSAIVEFANKKDAEVAFSIEKGKITCPLTLSWIKGDQPTSSHSPPPQPQPAQQAMSMSDFEAGVLKLMREAQKRKMAEGASNAKS